MSVDATKYIELDDVKNYWGLEGGIEANDDDLIKELILAVTAFVKTYTGREFYATDYIEYYSGDGSDQLHLINYPVNSVTNLWDDSDRGWTVSGTGYFESTEYTIKYDRYILLYDEYFTDYKENIKVQYNAGYAAIPADLKQAIIEMVVWKYKEGRKRMLGLSAQALDEVGSVNYYAAFDVLPGAKKVLDDYKNSGVR